MINAQTAVSSNTVTLNPSSRLLFSSWRLFSLIRLSTVSFSLIYSMRFIIFTSLLDSADLDSPGSSFYYSVHRHNPLLQTPGVVSSAHLPLLSPNLCLAFIFMHSITQQHQAQREHLAKHVSCGPIWEGTTNYRIQHCLGNVTHRFNINFSDPILTYL